MLGKTALITGAYGGLGKEVSIELAKNDCNLFLVGRDSLKIQNLIKEIKSYDYGVNIQGKAVDLSKDSDVKALLNVLLNNDIHIDILINNAGVFPIKNILESTDGDFDNCFAVNIRTPFILSRDLGKKMISNNWGRIVNIGSSSSYNGSGETGIYCASKHALLGLSRSLYQEFKDSGVRVYSVSPGSIQTPMGAIDTRQDYSTFINPKEVAEYIIFIITYDNEMISEEIRMNRITIK